MALPRQNPEDARMYNRPRTNHEEVRGPDDDRIDIIDERAVGRVADGLGEEERAGDGNEEAVEEDDEEVDDLGDSRPPRELREHAGRELTCRPRLLELRQIAGQGRCLGGPLRRVPQMSARDAWLSGPALKLRKHSRPPTLLTIYARPRYIDTVVIRRVHDIGFLMPNPTESRGAATATSP